ncbi:Aste57867_22858 [Aphanomyces stellatus]|uniref:Aste57867_22858 protein n=1 Tax=Aphanomyces stellatus TaxID=120398 RepID=A0A485LL26_9STRA|nr:hypothetical protein As57867_022787 [Aphanomyces stellatus]VFT99508.1 Aste57867_22858 [Aphanomyces stellatus]
MNDPQGHNYILHAVTPEQLVVLQPAILKLWDFRSNASNPLSMQELQEWALAGEFAVALSLPGPCAFYSADEVLASFATAPDVVQVVGTVRHVTVHRTKPMTQMLHQIGCPSFLYDPTKRHHDASGVAQGYFHIPSKSFQPATLGQRLPRIELGRDILTYLSSAFVAPAAEGTGLRHQLSYAKLARNMPHYCHAVRLGHRVYLTTTLYDHRANNTGLKFASSFFALVAKLARDIGVELGLGAAISFNVLHWSVQSCWEADATVVVACLDAGDGYDIDSSYLYTSPRASSISTMNRDSLRRSSLAAAAYRNTSSPKWWHWPKRLVKSMFSDANSRSRDSLVGHRPSRY